MPRSQVWRYLTATSWETLLCEGTRPRRHTSFTVCQTSKEITALERFRQDFIATEWYAIIIIWSNYRYYCLYQSCTCMVNKLVFGVNSDVIKHLIQHVTSHTSVVFGGNFTLWSFVGRFRYAPAIWNSSIPKTFLESSSKTPFESQFRNQNLVWPVFFPLTRSLLPLKFWPCSVEIWYYYGIV